MEPRVAKLNDSEFEKYIKQPVLSDDTDPLKFWQIEQNNCPNLSTLRWTNLFAADTSIGSCSLFRRLLIPATIESVCLVAFVSSHLLQYTGDP